MKTGEHLKVTEFHLRNGAKWSKPGDGLHFLFAVRGAGTYGFGGSGQAIVGGDVLLLHGRNGGNLSAAVGQEFICRHFSLLIEQIFPLLGGREISLLQTLGGRSQSLTLFSSTSLSAAKWHQMLQEVSIESGLESRAQLLRIAAAILNAELQASKQPQPVNHVERHMVDLFQHLTSDQILAFSVDDLAARFHCSRRHLNRVFHHYFKMSVATLKMEIRLRKATSLLRNPNTKVIDVAAQCGFNHLGLFNVCFRRKFGITPSQWRRNTGGITKKTSSIGSSAGLPAIAVSWNNSDVASTPDRALPGAVPVQTRVLSSNGIKEAQHQTVRTVQATKPLNLTAVLSENAKGLAFRVSPPV